MIAAGFGFRKGATKASLRDAYDRAGTADVLTTLADKAQAPAFRELAHDLGLPMHTVVTDPAAQTITTSQASLCARGLPSVAEATALAAAGPGARLLGPRVVSSDRMATCALAEAVP